ncbi:hypothetical protein ACKS0A_00117 [Histoplasma ohiense]
MNHHAWHSVPAPHNGLARSYGAGYLGGSPPAKHDIESPSGLTLAFSARLWSGKSLDISIRRRRGSRAIGSVDLLPFRWILRCSVGWQV